MAGLPQDIGPIRLKRVYETPGEEDGMRVLVERLWPRGMTKEKARVDLWLKAVAPSAELRRWFAHDPVRWEEFQRRYWNELSENPAVAELFDLARTVPVTLVYATSASKHNSALVLQRFLETAIGRTRPMTVGRGLGNRSIHGRAEGRGPVRGDKPRRRAGIYGKGAGGRRSKYQSQPQRS